MGQDPYSVMVVFDLQFNGNLFDLLRKGPVWIVDASHNRKLAEAFWRTNPDTTHLNGVTVFNNKNERTPEDALTGLMDTIDLHHGIYSADPPFTILEVAGTPNSNAIRAELSTYGFDQFEPIGHGFRAVRPRPAPFEDFV